MDKNAEVVEKTEPVVNDLTGDSEEEDEVDTKTTTHSTLPNTDVVTVVTLSADSEKKITILIIRRTTSRYLKSKHLLVQTTMNPLLQMRGFDN